jgi:transposase
MQLALWQYAISVGVGSATEIERRARTDTAFGWIVGDQKVSHDTLSAFRVEHGAALDGLMTDVLAVLLHKGLLSLDLVAQDGTRVRARAAAPSFRREARRSSPGANV